MIILLKQDIFTLNTMAIVNPVNCFGVMGKGLALQFKNRYFDYFEDYKFKCDYDRIHLQKVDVYELNNNDNLKYIISFPTKNHWRDFSNINDIVLGLKDLVKVVKEKNIESIAIPALGCGLGGLQWDRVKKIMVDELDCLENTTVYLLTP